MNTVNQDQIELLAQVRRQTGADSVTLFLYDRCASREPVRFLFNLGPTTETNRTYQDRICREDPFLRMATAAPAGKQRSLMVIDQQQAEAGSPPAATASYWEFMHRRGYCESAAAIREFSRDVYLVLGLMREQRAPAGRHLSGQPARVATERLFDHAAAAINEAAIRRFLDEPDDSKPEPVAAAGALTVREQEIAVALCRGLSNKRIAATLQLSEYTVENHLRRIYRKHGVHNRTSLMATLAPVKGSARP